MIFETETVIIASLKPHKRNYRQHPDDQLEHIITSIKEHGFYRNVVIAKDGTILAGHGVVKAAQKMGLAEVPVIRLDVEPDSSQAIKVLTGDNEISHLGEIDDRALSELLKEIKDVDLTGLLGTGYDEMMLANLVMVTRPASEIQDFDEAAAWVGMPEYDEGEERIKAVVSFRTLEDRERFMDLAGIEKPHSTTGKTWSFWWPAKSRDDLSSVKFKG